MTTLALAHRAQLAASRRLLVWLLWLLAASSSLAYAQPARFTTQRLEPAVSPLNYLVTERPEVLPHLSPAATLLLNYTHRPLIFSGAGGDQNLISYQLNMDVLVALGLFRFLEVGLGLPVTLNQSGDGLRSLGYPAGYQVGAGIGDLRLVVKARLWSTGPFALAISAPVSLPTGGDLLGGRTAFAPRVIAGVDTHWLGIALNLGYRLASDQSFTAPNGVQRISIDDEFFASTGLRGTIWPGRLDLLADLFFSLSTQELNREEVNAELAYGGRAYFGRQWTTQLLASNGLSRGVGTPTFRVIASIAYQYLPAGAPPPARARPVADDDPDHDGIRGAADRCPYAPEDKDGFEDEDGCPDPDNDKDGIPDSRDKCPLQAEDRDGFADHDGCPDLDNDGDGIPDLKDKCPLEPEDKDGFEDEDGCPDPDNDKDGIPDSRDKCPGQPEVFNGVEDEDGCPDRSQGPVQIQQGKVTTPPVFFATNKDVILKKSYRMLGQVFEALQANRWIKLVRIEGHTDSRGNDQKNLLLSRRRAESVRRFLVELGIDPDRLESEGFGETRPIEDNRTARGRARNRRVDFVIVDPVTATQ